MFSDKVIFLYKISDATKTWCYTNNDYNVDYMGNTYEAVTIFHDKIDNDGSEVCKQTIKIKMANSVPYIQNLMGAYDSLITEITIYRISNILSGGTANIEWIGNLNKINFDVSETSLAFGNLLYDTQRQSVKQVYQRYCPYALYNKQCKADKTAFRHITLMRIWERLNDYQLKAPVGTIETSKLGGLLEITDDGGNILGSYFIRAISEDLSVVTVNRPILHFGTRVVLYDGCNRSMSDCHRHFHNSENFGGFVLLPLEDPTSINYVNGGGANTVTSKSNTENIIGE